MANPEETSSDLSKVSREAADHSNGHRDEPLSVSDRLDASGASSKIATFPIAGRSSADLGRGGNAIRADDPKPDEARARQRVTRPSTAAAGSGAIPSTLTPAYLSPGGSGSGNPEADRCGSSNPAVGAQCRRRFLPGARDTEVESSAGAGRQEQDSGGEGCALGCRYCSSPFPWSFLAKRLDFVGAAEIVSRSYGAAGFGQFACC